MTDHRYYLAFIDWDKYGGCFRNLRQHPQNLIGCAYTMIDEFQNKDLLKGLPDYAPWDSIREIQAIGKQAHQLASQGKRIDPSTEEHLRRHCLRFGDWATSYFASSEPPSQRRIQTNSSSAAGPRAGGCGTVLLLSLLVPLYLLTHYILS